MYVSMNACMYTNGDFFDNFPQISENSPKISKEALMMFWSYSNTFLKGLCNQSNGNLFSNHGDTNILTHER